MPALATSREVPRSGCLAISNTGTRVSSPAIARRGMLGGRRFSDRYQATIIGTANLSSSEG